MGQLVGERWRESEKARERWRERRGCETDVPKLYTYNENEHSAILETLPISYLKFLVY